MAKKKGHIDLKWKGGKFKPIGKGVFGEDIGVAYLSGNKIEISQDYYGYLQENVIRPHNKNLGKIKSGKLETYEEIQRRNVREAKRIREEVVSSSHYIKHLAFVSKIPDIVDRMSEYLKDPSNPINIQNKNKVYDFLTEIGEMTEEELSKFYYDNAELFKDFTDYYDWLKYNSGKWDKDTKPGRRGKRKTATGYVNQMTRSLDKLIEKAKMAHK